MTRIKKSLKLNMVLNAIKGIMGVVFPLITFPYISRILGVENIGKYNFANSVINYFILFAGLGISTYAIREGARIRMDKQKLQVFASEIYSLNVYSTFFSYIILGTCLIIVPKFQEYKVLLGILSLQIIFKTIGIEWIYSIYEDYAYITIRSIVFQLLSLILMFLLVRTKENVNIYALITVFSSAGANVLNYIYARKFCVVKFIIKSHWHKHIKPIMVLFAMALTVSIYVNSDITILGFLCNDYIVGIYSVAVKVYSVVKVILSSVLVVSIPRLSSLLVNNDMQKFNFVAGDIYKTLLSIVIPAIIGLILLRNEIVFIISDYTYAEAAISLAILAVALLFCMGAWFWGQCILVPMKLENRVFRITIVSATVNIFLNLILIPIYGEKAAAFTTLISEMLSFFYCGYVGKKYVKLVGIKKLTIKVSIGCIGIVGVSILINIFIKQLFIKTVLIISFSILIYLAIEILLGNEIFVKGGHR